MIDRGKRPPSGPDANLDPTLAELTEEITRRLQSGEAVDLQAYADRHPESAGPIRALLPTLHDLVDLGRSVALERGEGPRSDPPHPSPRKKTRP